MNKAPAIVGNILALLIFGVGLLSPLTPSEGAPSIGAVITFAGLPLAFMLNAWRCYSNKAAKYAVVFQSLCVVGFTGWLILIQAGV